MRPILFLLEWLEAGCKLTKSGYEPFPDPTQYRSIVGALQNATITQPEISFTVNKVCQYMSDPSEQHWRAVKQILPPSTRPPFTVHATMMLTGHLTLTTEYLLLVQPSSLAPI